MTTCHACRASSAEGGPMICERDGCPGQAARIEREAMQRAERAYERGEHVDRVEAIEERRERLREWDRAMGCE